MEGTERVILEIWPAHLESVAGSVRRHGGRDTLEVLHVPRHEVVAMHERGRGDKDVGMPADPVLGFAP